MATGIHLDEFRILDCNWQGLVYSHAADTDYIGEHMAISSQILALRNQIG